MKPLVYVVGCTYEDARRYVLANRDTRPILAEARLVSASARPSTADASRAHKVIETPGAFLGTHYAAVMATLRLNVERTRPLT